ncbi:MAG: efflux RND transporter periplasmic adaptor subunit [Sedimentisphaerales bacterium]|nr:efflux RND transporter periplasmic adaptor subunit [Sedimentisphaerales bacterium]
MSKETPEKTTAGTRAGWLRRNIIKAIIVLVVIGALVGVSKIPKTDRQVEATEAPPVNVSVMTVAAEPELADTFTLPAVVEPNRVVTVSAEVSGRIERISPEKGDRVSAGDLLVELNSDLLRPQFEMAKAQVEFNQIEFERMENLVKDNATARRDLDNAKTQLDVSKAQLEEIEARLNRTRILAPMSGVMNNKLVEEGEYVDPGAPVAEIVETDTVKAVVEIPESDVGFFRVGDRAEVRADFKGEEEDTVLVGKLTFISELADSQTRSTRVEITLKNDKRLLRSGQIVRAHLTRQILRDAILIPLLAVIPMEDGKAVYVVNSTEAKRCDVKLGFIKGDRVQVRSGLKPGDKLITSGHRFVAPGQTVNIVSEKK